MKLRVMAKQRNAEEAPKITSFRRAGIEFPCCSPGYPHGGPVELTLVHSNPSAEDGEIDAAGLDAILREKMLIIERSKGVEQALNKLVNNASEKREKFDGAFFVEPNGFSTFAPDPVTVQEQVGEDLSKQSKAALGDMAQNMGIDVEGLSKADVVAAIQAAGANS